MKKIEVSLKEILLAVIQRWWVIVLCAVIGLGAAYVVQKNQLTTQKEAGPADSYEEQLALYEKKLEEYETQSEELKAVYEKWRDSTTPMRNSREDYLQYFKDSLLMRINPYNAQKAFVQLSIFMDDTAQPVNEEMIPLLVEIVNNMPLMDVLGNGYPAGIEESVLREIIRVRQIGKNSMAIECFAVEESDVDPQSIVESVFQYIKKRSLDMGIGKNVQKLDSGFVRVSDFEIDMAKYERTRNFARFHDELQRMAGYEAQNKEGYDRYSKDKAPVKPVQKAESTENTSVGVDKQKFLIGALIGATIALVILVLLHLYRLPVLHENQVSQQLDIRHLGGINAKKRQSEITQKEYSFICTNLDRRDLNKQQFLLLGNRLPLKELETLATGLNQAGNDKGMEFSTGDDVLETEETINLLNQIPDVILVVKKGESTIRNLYQEIERVNISLGKVVGYIFVNI